MIIRVLEDHLEYNLKKGLRDVKSDIARELIIRGYAVKEKAVDQEAHDSLQDAKNRDQHAD